MCFSRLLMHMELDDNVAAHANKALDNQHIVMVGDSLMRYQYFSLVHLAHYGFFPNRTFHPNIVLGWTYKTWNEFYIETNKLLSPNEYCDCHREIFPDLFENRYYFNKVRNLTISFLLYIGDSHPMRGHWQPTDTERNDYPRRPDLVSLPPKWSYNTIVDLLTNIAAQLTPKPSVLLLNAGLHPNNYTDPSHVQTVTDAAKSLFDRVIWKTTSPTLSGNHSVLTAASTDKAVCAVHGIECMNLDWTVHLLPHDYADTKHFSDLLIYSDINIQFIKHVVHNRGQNGILKYVPVPPELRFALLVLEGSTPEKSYFVDSQGFLYAFTSDVAEKSGCLKEYNLLRRVSRTKAQLGVHLRGDSQLNVCNLL